MSASDTTRDASTFVGAVLPALIGPPLLEPPLLEPPLDVPAFRSSPANVRFEELQNGFLQAADLRKLAVDVVAFSGSEEETRTIRHALAQCEGQIVPLVTEVLNTAAYVVERSVCVDTTAAGGNATLLAGSA